MGPSSLHGVAVQHVSVGARVGARIEGTGGVTGRRCFVSGFVTRGTEAGIHRSPAVQPGCGLMQPVVRLTRGSRSRECTSQGGG